jgi:hypothetical protein
MDDQHVLRDEEDNVNVSVEDNANVGVEDNVSVGVDTMPKTSKKKTQDIVGHGRPKWLRILMKSSRSC